MTGQDKITRGYAISVRGRSDYHVLYAPRGVQQVRGDGAAPRPVSPPFDAAVEVGDEVKLRWVNPPTDRDATKEDFERDAIVRVRALHEWIDRLDELVRTVDGWAKGLGWATRVIEKKLEDSRIGKYVAPALLMQEGTDRVLLEPIARWAPGVEGVVDLYLMPAYDDVATLFYFDGAWHLRLASAGDAPSVTEVAVAFSRETFEEALSEMRQHDAQG